MMAMKYGIRVLFVAFLLYATVSLAAEQTESVPAALHAALAKDIQHASEWLDQADYKSLAQSAGGLQLLAEMLKARSDDAAWQAATGKIVSAASNVQAAARGEDAAKCKSALDGLEKAASAAAASKPTGKPQTLARVPPIRSLMLTMDATMADGKIAVMTGNVDAAKKQAAVLAELAKLVSNSRSTDNWPSLAGDFVTATQAAANTTQTNPQSVRQLFRGIAERCDGCHEKNRTR
jgi:hypothetical protein